MNKDKTQATAMWRLLLCAIAGLSALAYSPVIVQLRTYTPEFLGLPYTLWTTLAIAALLMVCVFVAAIIAPEDK